jgi:DNA-directed RNA polymerase subunit K/omega
MDENETDIKEEEEEEEDTQELIEKPNEVQNEKDIDEDEETDEEPEEPELEPEQEVEGEEYESEDEDDIDDEEYKKLYLSDIKEIKIVPENERMTSNYLQLHEYTELIGNRARHIEKGADIYVDGTGLDDPIKIAKKELWERKFPLNLNRDFRETNTREIWNPNTMTLATNIIEDIEIALTDIAF